jgi:ABC-type transporter Mla MlaB component
VFLNQTVHVSSAQPVKLTASEATRFLAQEAKVPSAAIDLSKLVEFDSAGLAALVQIAPKTILKHAPEKLRKLAALYGMDRIFS